MLKSEIVSINDVAPVQHHIASQVTPSATDVWPEMLCGAELSLSQLDFQYADALLATWGRDEQVFKTLSSKPVDSEEIMSRLITSSLSRFKNGEQYRYAILLNGLPIGVFTLTPHASIAGLVEIGLSVASAFWGKGVARRAISLAAKQADGFCSPVLFFATARIDNTKSASLLTATGFENAGRVNRCVVYGEACYEPLAVSELFFAKPSSIINALL